MDIIEALIDYLADNDITAVTELAEGATLPQIRIEEAGGGRTDSRTVNRLRLQDVQVDVWAGTKAAAHDLAWDVHDLLLAWPRFRPLPALLVPTFTACTKPSYQPDEDWINNGRPSPRFMMLGTVHAHERKV